MPRYNVTVSFSLTTEIEPEGVRFDADAEEFVDNSYFQTTEVDADGGSLTFTVEAEDEDDAIDKADEIISEGNEVEDHNGFTWLIQDVNVEAERVIVPMDLDRAKVMVREFLSTMEGMDEELKEAFSFLQEMVALQRTELTALQGAIDGRDAEIRRLQGELDRLQRGPDGSEAPEAPESIEDRMARLAREDALQ